MPRGARVAGRQGERGDTRRLDVAVEGRVVRQEGLVVRAVPRLGGRKQRDDEPGTDPRPTRLVAWMYSEVVFGCPFTSIRPSRGTSTPTEIMFVLASSDDRARRLARRRCNRASIRGSRLRATLLVSSTTSSSSSSATSSSSPR